MLLYCFGLFWLNLIQFFEGGMIAIKGPGTERVENCINFIIIELTLKIGLIIQ